MTKLEEVELALDGIKINQCGKKYKTNGCSFLTNRVFKFIDIGLLPSPTSPLHIYTRVCEKHLMDYIESGNFEEV